MNDEKILFENKNFIITPKSLQKLSFFIENSFKSVVFFSEDNHSKNGEYLEIFHSIRYEEETGKFF